MDNLLIDKCMNLIKLFWVKYSKYDTIYVEK